MSELLGRVTLRPGRPDAVSVLPSRGWLNRLASGRGVDELPRLVASVHTLCAHGHALAARLALRAAEGQFATPSHAERESLALAVARDHLLRIAHDWPRLLPEGGLEPLPLHECPAWRAGGSDAERLAALGEWLHRHWLDVPPAGLLEALRSDPAGAALLWSRRAGTPPARLLRRELPAALALPTRHRPLRADTASAALPAFEVPDTGPWTRVNDTSAIPAHNAGMRLIARLADLLRLAAPGGEQWLLAQGTPAGHGRGLARVEVGRGLLCYEVGVHDESSVAFLRVASPTDWNLHPAGVLAEALQRVDDSRSATRLAVAFDPCVPFDIELREAACA
jgi:hypothetical protein